MNKEERYDWAKPGDRGRQCLLRVEDLKINHAYQRAQLSDENILAIARDFRWELFGVLIVMERNNGDMYVVDGQQRLAAAKRRGDIVTVPCQVFRADETRKHAAAFLGINTRRKLVSAIDKFRAAVWEESEPQLSVSRFLREVGLVVGVNSAPSVNMSFPDLVCVTWKRNEDITKRAVKMQIDICGGEDSLNHSIHKGFVYLLAKGFDIEQYAQKIKAAGGKTALMGAINKAKENGSFSGISEKVAALGVLYVINKHRRNKMHLVVDGTE